LDAAEYTETARGGDRTGTGGAEAELKALQRHAFGIVEPESTPALTREWSVGGQEPDQFGEGTRKTRAILKFGCRFLKMAAHLFVGCSPVNVFSLGEEAPLS
jgi:hypothetical protein